MTRKGNAQVALYQILTTPGQEEVNLQEWLGDDAPVKLDNQDKCRIVMQGLRAIERKNAKKEDRAPRDFVVVPIKNTSSNGSSTSAGTSVRLTEEVRRELAKVCGMMMAETGDPLSMGDAVLFLVNYYRDNRERVAAALAREARLAAKAEREAQANA